MRLRFGLCSQGASPQSACVVSKGGEGERRGGGGQGFIQDFSKRGGNHLTPPTYQETVPITNVLTARIHLWKKL